jgi:hypothetical protein
MRLAYLANAFGAFAMFPKCICKSADVMGTCSQKLIFVFENKHRPKATCVLVNMKLLALDKTKHHVFGELDAITFILPVKPGK